MTLNEYQSIAWSTALPSAKSPSYMVLGLASEAGEVAGKFKKQIRDGISLNITEQMADELGDSLWYIAGTAKTLGFTLEEIAARNVQKLADRQQRGVISGSGDNR